MNLTKIEHIGIAVKDLEESIKLYEDIFGLKCYAIEEVEDQKVRTAFFLLGETKIELLESTEPDGPIARFIANKGEGIHHIAFATDNLDEALKEAGEKKIQLVNKESRTGAEGFKIAFLHPKSTNGILIELCEQRKQL